MLLFIQDNIHLREDCVLMSANISPLLTLTVQFIWRSPKAQLAKKGTKMFLCLVHTEFSLCELVDVILVSYRYIVGGIDHKGTVRSEKILRMS